MKTKLNSNKIHISKKRYKKKKINFNYYISNITSLINKKLAILLDKQVEAYRRVISKKTQRNIKLHNQFFFKLPVLKKSRGSRMGKGQGKFTHFVYILKPGQVIFKLFGLSIDNYLNASKFANKKLPNYTRFSQ